MQAATQLHTTRMQACICKRLGREFGHSSTRKMAKPMAAVDDDDKGQGQGPGQGQGHGLGVYLRKSSAQNDR